MSSNTVGALKRFLAKIPDDAVVYGYEEVSGINFDGKGPSCIVVHLPDGTAASFATGDYAWTHKREPLLTEN